ncbi:MAG: AzlC family ABC transporter permease [Atopobiaceae bacterium]|nr:AzlC family ABC transporter permease [Atopobiaceae bacterium]MCH4180140.1 AzlC family ABC transporter permease [Atopobiaceae bacterium]MCH4213808.1 AzlC family ABC transporter permease [Atopobiaceae bacterium]MCI1226691.1 AzlC family ABC transporter permease [Atopobiaceae bacterium]MCI1259448.1 AzlC family ABC transporter permease [Atopobiaceae bacterium]
MATYPDTYESARMTAALQAALPVMLGYVAIGIPCGILEDQIGVGPLLAFVVSMTFYSGAGQFMVCNMVLAGQPLLTIAASVSLVSTRQVLYSAAFSPYFSHTRRWLATLFSATVTDESFGVNLGRFAADASWTPAHATLVNLLCMTSWGVSNALGSLVGSVVGVPVAVASFAMTAIFICLAATQPHTPVTAVVMVAAALGVVVCKCAGLAGAGILVGAVVGVAAGLVAGEVGRR